MKKIKLIRTKFTDLYIVSTKKSIDKRGCFFRAFCQKDMSIFLRNKKIVQINISKNKNKGTVRGLHYQIGAYSEKKIVMCLKGEFVDYVVDIRENSSTYLDYFKIKLSEKDDKILLIPEGFAHGFITTKKNTEILYLHTNEYNKKSERGLNFQDPALKLNIKVNKKLISKKDYNIKKIDSNFKSYN